MSFGDLSFQVEQVHHSNSWLFNAVVFMRLRSMFGLKGLRIFNFGFFKERFAKWAIKCSYEVVLLVCN